MHPPPRGTLLTANMAQALGYWNGLRAARTAPSLLDLDPFFAPSLTQSAIAVDVSGAAEEFTIWGVGEKLSPFLRQLQPGMRLDMAHGTPEQSTVWQTYLDVKTMAVPHIAGFDYTGGIAGIISTLELFLPFQGPEGDGIHDVLALIEFSDMPVPDSLRNNGQREALTPQLVSL